MIPLLISLYLCPATIMINRSDIPWNDHDLKTRTVATNTCKKNYKDCLKRFVKKEAKHYIAICGGKTRK